MTERQPHHQPEKPRSHENSLATEITPVIARIIDTQTIDTPEGKRLTYDRVNKASLDSRKKFYEGNTDDFETRRGKWNRGLKTWIEKMTKEDVPGNVERAETLLGIGIDAWTPADRRPEDVKIEKQIENFRQKYLDKGESHVGKFVEDIAKDCKDKEGNVDLTKLGTRLHAIEPMLVVFGTDKDINKLVEEFVVAHGHVNQKDNQATVKEVAKQMTEPVPQAAHERLRAIGIDPDLIYPMPSPVIDEREKPIKVDLPEAEAKEPAIEGEIIDNEEKKAAEKPIATKKNEKVFRVINGEFREVTPDEPVHEKSEKETVQEDLEKEKQVAKNPQTPEQARKRMIQGRTRRARNKALVKGTEINEENAKQGVFQVDSREDVKIALKALRISQRRTTEIIEELRPRPQTEPIAMRVVKISGENDEKDEYDVEILPSEKKS